MSNPLQQYFRQPATYIKLPSDGKYYPDHALDLPPTRELAVYPMTAKDEMSLRTPDALLNGQAVIDVIRSCMPGIKDPWAMPSCDVDACFIAIRMASYGSEMELDTKCPNCGEEWRFAIDLRNFLDQTMNFSWQDKVTVGDLTFSLWPLNYDQVTKNQIRVLEEERAMQIINNSELAEDQKLKEFAVSFNKLTDITFSVITSCVHAISAPGVMVTDANEIREFFENCDSQVFTHLREEIDKLKDQQMLKPVGLTCQACQHHYEVPVSFDQSFFSGPNS
jgi:RNase P subunit RPR2